MKLFRNRNISCKEITDIERITRNAWPAFEERNLNSWILRCANGYRQRSNSVCTCIYTGSDAENDIRIAESWYSDKGQKAIFKVTACSEPAGLAEILEAEKYVSGRETLVMTCAARGNSGSAMKVETSMKCDESWFKANSENGYADDDYINILSRITNGQFVKIISGGRIAGSFYIAFESDYAGLYSLYIKREFRERGLGKQTIGFLHSAALERGAGKLYLQVEAENETAVALYASTGFETANNYIYYTSL